MFRLADDDRALVERFRRARSDQARAVLEGFHPLKHALRFGAAIEEAWSADPAHLDQLAARLSPDVREWLRAEVRPVAPEVFSQLAPVAPASGVIALARRPRVDVAAVLAHDDQAPVVLLESPSHLGNVGAVVRVAAAAGAAAVLATGRHDPWHPVALRGSAGLHFALPVAGIDALPDAERPLIALAPEGEPLRVGAIPAAAILAFGSERRGLGPQLLQRARRCIAIPMRPGVSSLNLATAAAIVLYQWRLGRRD